MTAMLVSTKNVCDYSPAEVILNMKPDDVLRLSFCQNVQTGRVQWVELYIWLCPNLGFFRGLNIISGKQVSTMSESPLNSRQLLLHINDSSFQPGSDQMELLSDMNVEDLQRLHKLSRIAA